MESLLWFFTNAGPLDVLGPVLFPLAVGLVLYQWNYLGILFGALWRSARGEAPPTLDDRDRWPAVATVPSLLRRRGELEGLKRAARSLAENGYPGPLTIVLAIDGVDERPELVTELAAFVRSDPFDGATLLWTGNATRCGKGVAIDTGVAHAAAQAESGVIERPVLFFNVDADSEVGVGALEIMAATLVRRSRLTGERARIVTSHVAVPRAHYWRGWRALGSVRGLLALSVAREYLVSLGLGRFNSRLQPQTGASGALYCSWFAILEAAPLYARFLTTLRWADWFRWWVGTPPPSFRARRDRLEPLPEGVAGMGDDTWVTWLALAARWKGDRLDFDYPPTPAHAFVEFVRSYVVRPYRYDPRAKIWTATPTAARGLYRQRMRWNTSRLWTAQRWGLGLLFAWPLGVPALAEVAMIVAIHALVLVGLVLFPATVGTGATLAALTLIALAYFLVRTTSTLLGFLVDGEVRWALLLALPFSGVYHFAFNILPTIHGFVLQILGFGFNSGFSPERTLIVGGSSRVALAYRVRRAYTLALRSVLFGDVPIGRFWFGWRATRWTPNGYEGWDDERTRAPALVPESSAVGEAVAGHRVSVIPPG